MRSQEFIAEQEPSSRERFEREPSATGKLVIFDIDDTLVNTDTKINVVRDGKIIKQLNSHDFTHYQLQPGEKFDFGGFRDAREFYTQARPIPGMIRQLKRDIETGNKVIMLTARSDFNDRDVFLDTFRQYDIDMDQIHVYRAGNLVTKAATEEKKKIILRHLLGKHPYEKVIMYDDSVPNLNAFLSLKQDFPQTQFYAWHVDPSGQASEYHRTDIRLNELGDAPADYRPNRKRSRSLFHATVDNHWVDVFFDRSELNGTLHITFAVNSDYEPPDRPTAASKSTARILSTVLNIIKEKLPEYVKRARPPAISFTARGDNRARLYRKYFVPVMQNILGSKWQHQEFPSMGMTVFNWRPVKKKEVTEGVRAYHGNQGGIDTKQLHAPMWFTASREDAEYYAGDDGYVVVAYLDITNPYVIQPGQEEPNTVLRNWQELQAQGYDGIYDPRLGDWIPFSREQIRVISKEDTFMGENFADGRVKGKSRPGRVKRSGASCKGSVTDLRARAKKYGGERGKMYHWCANMKSGRQKK